MKKKIIIPFLLFAANCFAQNSSLSLNDAVYMALANRYDLKIQKVNTEIAKKQKSEVGTRSLPQITSDLDWRYNTQLQTNVIPGGVFAQPNSSDKLVQFGTKFNTLLGFNLNQSIFNPANVADRDIANIQSRYQEQNEKLAEVNIKQEVTEAYFAALLWKEKLKLSEENIKKTKLNYETTQNLFNMAQATNYDVQRNKIDLENAEATAEQSKRSYDLAINDLLYKIAADSIKNPVLSDSISGLLQQSNFNATYYTPINRTEITQQKLQINIYNDEIRKQNLMWIPTISLYGNYSFQYLNNDFSPATLQNWFPFNYLGIKASIPIFDGGLKAKTKQEYHLRAQAAKFQYSKLESDYRQERLTAGTSLNNSITDLNYQKKNLALIEDLYRIDTDRFKNGTIKQSDLTTTYYTLQQTETNYITSVYNYLIAVINYTKAIGAL